MLTATITGYLSTEPRKAFANASGEVYRIRFATNHSRYDSKTKTWDKKTIWCSGLLSEKKMGLMQKFFVKGAPVVVSSSDCHIVDYVGNDGVTRYEFDLGFIDRIEVYNRIPKDESSDDKANFARSAAPQQGRNDLPL